MRRIFGRVPVDPRAALCFYCPRNEKPEKEERVIAVGKQERSVFFRYIFCFSFKWEEHVSTLRFMDERMDTQKKRMFGFIIFRHLQSMDMDMEMEIKMKAKTKIFLLS